MRKDRAKAEKYLLERYSSDKFNIIQHASLPGEYYDDPDSPPRDHEVVDESPTQGPIALYRVEGANLSTSKGKTVVLLLYAHPHPNFGVTGLALKMQTIVQAMDNAGMFAVELNAESLTTFTRLGEETQLLTWHSLPDLMRDKV